MLSSGDILSHYKIVSAIGAGGMGEVYLAEDTKLGRQVALKVLLSEVSGDKDRVGRFVQEAKAASALNHPNILTVFEIGNFEGSNYIATELIKGTTLRERMRKDPLGLIAALDVAMQITAALGAAHEAGIIHRDVKPENIMVRDDGLVKVLDFGLAKLLPASAASIETTLHQHNTKPGMLIGTVAYMSPEQARGRKIDPRSDIFSLGIVLFELFTGKRPFEGEGHLDLISSILKDEPPPLRTVAPDLPKELERIVSKTLRKDRDHRYQHIKDLNLDIEDLKDELKFEAKLSNSIHPTVDAQVHYTNQNSFLNTRSNLRSALTTGISKTRRFTLLHALVFLALIGSVLTTVWYLRPVSSPVAAGTYKSAELATWSSAPGELFSSARFSPDGKLVAFASTRSGTKGIWLAQTTSTDAIQVTNDAFSNTDPIWSSKGDEIAFLSQRPNAAGGTSTGIWRVSALGGSPRSVTPIDGGGSQLRRWTQSGKVYYEIRGELYFAEISSGSTQKVTSLGEGKAKWVSISADEKSIAYATGTDEQWQIFSSDIAGTKPVELARGTGKIDRTIAWLPEKERIFFTATADGVSHVFVTRTGSFKNDQLASPETESSIVDASPDGRSIILSSAKEESNLWRVGISDGTDSPAVRDLNAKLWPSISPDGTKIVFESVKNLSAGNKLLAADIAVKNLKAGAAAADRSVTIAEKGFLPAWSPDGSAIAFLREGNPDTNLSVVNAAGGGEKLIASLGKLGSGYSISPYNLTQTTVFDWAPDGSKIAFVLEQAAIPNLMTVSPRDGTLTQITSNSDPAIFFQCPIWASDGWRIAFSFQKRGKDENGKVVRGIRVLDTRTGTVSNVIETTRVIRLIGWNPDETGLVIAEASKDNSGLPPETVLSGVPVAEGAETVIGRLKNIYFYNIFLSKDRKQIAFAARDNNMDNLWIASTTGGSPRRLTNNNDSGLLYSRLAWLPDNSAVIIGKQTRFSLLAVMTDIDI